MVAIFSVFLAMAYLLALPYTTYAVGDLSAQRLKQIIDSGKPIFLLNPLSKIEFNEAHIPGSINIPAEEILATKKLPKRKDTMIVTYCKGPKWVLYKQAAGLVANRLYSNVATFKGGLPAWKKAGYPLNTSLALPKYDVPGIDGGQFKALVGQACILDIRTPKLYGLGNIKGKFGPNVDTLSMEYKKKYLVKIPMSKLAKQYRKIPQDRPIVVMDFRGKQSLVASRFLMHQGFKDVVLLKGGISAVSD